MTSDNQKYDIQASKCLKFSFFKSINGHLALPPENEGFHNSKFQEKMSEINHNVWKMW